MTKFYIATAAQNSTALHTPFWQNLVAYQRYLGAELLVGRFIYNTGAGPTVSDATIRKGIEPAYDPRIEQRMFEGDLKPRKLAPSLWWCPEMNILPTAGRPLTGLHTYGAGASIIIPHAKVAMNSLPTAHYARANFAYTTGAATRKNYIAKKAGLMAAFHHSHSALIIEVQGDRWWVRQLNANSLGKFHDLTNCVDRGKVTTSHPIETISWGDIHASEVTASDLKSHWGGGGILEHLQPRVQFMHDLFSSTATSHHEIKKPSFRYRKWVEGHTMLRDIDDSARFLRAAHRDWCKTVVVRSNHDEHPDRWLDEADPNKDPANAEIFYEAKLAQMRGHKDWMFVPWAMYKYGGPDEVQFLSVNDTYKVKGVEHSHHGHKGPNGSRGSPLGLSRMADKCTTGHIHAAGIIDGVYTGGVTGIEQEYAEGPGSWSQSHVLQYDTGKRAIVTCFDGIPWA